MSTDHRAEQMDRMKRIAAAAREDGRTEPLSPLDLYKLHMLERVPLESVWGLLEQCPVREVEEGEVLIEKGHAGEAIMYMVLAGRLSIALDSPDSEPVAFIDAGQSVGELSVIDHRPTSAYVLASCPSRLLAVDEETFWRMVAASHEFAKNLLLLLTRRLRANNFTIEENMRLRKLLERDIAVDSLTGLRNRRWLDENLPRLMARYRRNDKPLSVLMLDVDYFKTFNDTYGHASGDRVLSVVAGAVVSRLRPTDFGARYGGEEFVVILPGTDLGGAAVAAERLRATIAATEVEGVDAGMLPPVTVSIGVAGMAGGEKADALLSRADTALYRAKNNGRDRVEREK
jgi:diguanylate cyclase (GGDEF)-like protein